MGVIGRYLLASMNVFVLGHRGGFCSLFIVSERKYETCIFTLKSSRWSNQCLLGQEFETSFIILSKYSAEISHPLNFLWVRLEAMAVVPLPRNVSRTVSPSLECFLISSSNRARLF